MKKALLLLFIISASFAFVQVSTAFQKDEPEQIPVSKQSYNLTASIIFVKLINKKVLLIVIIVCIIGTLAGLYVNAKKPVGPTHSQQLQAEQLSKRAQNPQAQTYTTAAIAIPPETPLPAAKQT